MKMPGAVKQRVGADFRVVILSSRAENLVPCVRAVLQHEPQLDPKNIIAVDDGTRVSAEGALPAVQWITGIKPFVFARTVNLAINAARRDVFLVNDDARLITPGGSSMLAADVRGKLQGNGGDWQRLEETCKRALQRDKFSNAISGFRETCLRNQGLDV